MGYIRRKIRGKWEDSLEKEYYKIMARKNLCPACGLSLNRKYCGKGGKHR